MHTTDLNASGATAKLLKKSGAQLPSSTNKRQSATSHENNAYSK